MVGLFPVEEQLHMVILASTAWSVTGGGRPLIMPWIY